ncbi:MAG: hypothetical protein J6Q54_05550, partial [Oscillospiraceae bacterium]|nr:hypothetical protein [Oscillospiraceae bacterium]
DTNVFATVMKVLTAIAAIIGIIYVIAVYGERIAAWAKDLLERLFDKRTRFFNIEEQLTEEEPAPAEEAEVAPAE